jgi:tRNA pseudouridine38-40 synthase
MRAARLKSMPLILIEKTAPLSQVEEKKNISMILAYDGSGYHGWQRQKNAHTIQEEIENKIRLMTGESVNLIASGRTDAGVHALHQVCHFMTESKIDPEAMMKGLNALLPPDILVKEACYRPFDFHARYSAKSKCYEYRILNRTLPDPFLRLQVWHIQPPLNIPEMRRCSEKLLGSHDFSAFKSTGSGNRNPVREMNKAELHGPDQDILRLFFEADGFLRHMVRNIVGTLVDVGKGKMDVNGFVEILESRDRRKAGIKAPPQGLFLTKVTY